MQPDRDAWIEAGGNAERLTLLESIGEMAAFSDGDSRCLAGIHPERPDVGTVSDWVGDVAQLHAAEAWLAERGCKVARGPKELCSWFPFRAVQGPFDEAPFFLEITQRAERWVEAGYEPVSHYVSVVAEHGPHIAQATDRASSLSARGWTVQSLPATADNQVPTGAFKEAIEEVHRLFSRAFAEQQGYVNIPAAALYQAYAPFRALVDPRLSMMARTPDGEAVGFLLALPDHLQPERGWFTVLTLAVAPEYRRSGVGTWLLGATHRAAQKAGFRAGVHAMVRVDRPDWQRYTGGDVFRRYVLLQRELSGSR